MRNTPSRDDVFRCFKKADTMRALKHIAKDALLKISLMDLFNLVMWGVRFVSPRASTPGRRGSQ